MGEAINDASTATGIDVDEEALSAAVTIYNGPEAWCGYGVLDGRVAEAIVGKVVQPYIMSMKMAEGTVDLLIEGLREYFNDTAQLNELIGDDDDDDEERERERERERRRLQEQSESDEKGTDGNSGPIRLKPPSATLTFCPGVVTLAEYKEFLLDPTSDSEKTTEMTDWLVARTDLGNETASLVQSNVYWSYPERVPLKMDDTTGDSTARGEFWEKVIGFAFEGDECVSTFTNNLKWSALPGATFADEHGLLMEFYEDEDAADMTIGAATDAVCLAGLLPALAVRPDICHLEITPKKATANYNAQWMVQTGVVNQRPFYDVGLDGTGQTVAISDTGIDVNNCYFADEKGQITSTKQITSSFTSDSDYKIAQYDDYVNSDDYTNGHGTHVAGTVAGRRPDAPGASGEGIAPGAKLAFIDIGFNDGSLSLPNDSHLLGTGRTGATTAHIHSASWGSPMVDSYTFQARSFDNYMYSNDDFLIIVAAGNDGRYDVPNSVGSPATAKNIIAVGAAHSYGDDLDGGMLGPSYMADFSSRGPTRDGRMKPDLVAQGKYILSAAAQPNDPGACDAGIPRAGGSKGGLLSMAGTSMATPVTSGTAALVRQYFEEGWFGDGTKSSGDSFSPSGALVKAVLMNGAQTNMKGVDNSAKSVMSSSTPVSAYDNSIGFGRISLTHSLYIKGKTDVGIKHWDRQELAYNGQMPHTVTIDKSNGCTWDQLSVTLVWVEPGSASGCVRCLVNDLDLVVTKNGDETKKFYPNGLSSKDSMNTAERVVIDGVQDGDSFTLTVEPGNMDTRTQNFALVATGCFGGVANSIDTSQNVFDADDKGLSQTSIIIISVCSVIGALIIGCGIYKCFQKRQAASEGGKYENSDYGGNGNVGTDGDVGGYNNEDVQGHDENVQEQ